ncbi:hypothetical protein Pcinc_007346 [Petrolisthes cinctipes]|uniref:Uncharacterized protein n=1 Tax=Petrolisthes cinctipes TaxID=88211 RepID=A0AAE1KX05_PETCI|nr:hypothetical protein Pcinc_007346 [Petrolisthes cinctipes]
MQPYHRAHTPGYHHHQPRGGVKSQTRLQHSSSPSHQQEQQPLTQPKSTSVSPLNSGPHQETHTLLGALSSKRDSTYSSMSEYSGRTSPTNSCRSSVGDSVGSGVGSPVGGEAQGHISFGLQYVSSSPEASAGKLVITVNVS